VVIGEDQCCSGGKIRFKGESRPVR